MHVPPENKRRGISPAFLIWVSAVAIIIALEYLDSFLGRFGRGIGLLNLLVFFAWLFVIALTLYGFAVFSRWILGKLFWTVGRRLFLSYLLIGLLPFVLMTILLFAIVYMFAAVMTQTAIRGERQATLGLMENWALEYAMTGRRPSAAPPSLEIYDTARARNANLPQWLQQTTFSGIVSREDTALLLTARQFTDDHRSVVFAQPMDKTWAQDLFDKWQIIVRTMPAIAEGENFNIPTKNKGLDNIKWSDHLFTKIIWGDLTELTDWNTGQHIPGRQLFTLIISPPRSLLRVYFGSDASTKYFRVLATVTMGITGMLMMMYIIAALFAVVLIFSISRAVNRIEKGTKAVERGDFSYRIRMKRANQLGAMAQSFDRMTESIASLLITVAEKERLQSEIEIAATIQRNLLPKEGPKFRGVSFSAHFEPTASIGGDYYDVFNLDKSRLAVAIGDVSGHGLSTGLVMAMVKAAITTLVEEGADETSLFHRLNELVYRSTERRAFMTLAFTIFDLERGTVRHTNAGHLYPYLLRSNTPAPISIESPSLPLGVRANIVTRTTEVDLQEGDTVVYLSDGIVEAQDENGDPIGFDQIELLLTQLSDRSPDAVRDAILEAIARHSGSRPADDDRTVMVLRFENLEIGSEAAAVDRAAPALA